MVCRASQASQEVVYQVSLVQVYLGIREVAYRAIVASQGLQHQDSQGLVDLVALVYQVGQVIVDQAYRASQDQEYLAGLDILD